MSAGHGLLGLGHVVCTGEVLEPEPQGDARRTGCCERPFNAFERYLSRNGIVVLKFFLNVTKKEQKKRFLERLDQPEKNWKFSATDVLEREHWDEYMRAYEEMIRNTSTKRAPWYVVPADHKWFTRVVVAEALVHALDKLDLSFPQVDAEKRKDLKKARAILKHEK